MIPIDRQREVREVWDWLPAFRAIAETEHLPTAAARMGVTAPALSRTLRLLEEHIGQPLFHRVGRRLQLAPAGESLRASVRDAMRRVHDGLNEVSGLMDSGPVVVSAQGLVVPYVTQALVDLAVDRPRLRPSLVAPQDVRADLLAGRLDVAFQTARLSDERLVTELLGAEPTSIWCGPGHPLHGKTDVTVQDVCIHRFVAPPPLDNGDAPEGWPAHLPRDVELRVHRMDLGAAWVSYGRHLAVLPNVTAQSGALPLWRVPVDITPDAPVYAVRRYEHSTQRSVVQSLIALVRRSLQGD